MTKEIILPIEEISDSVEMLHEKPSKGMAAFVWILVALLTCALIWCYLGEIDYYLRASGAVRTTQNASNISSISTGRISEINIAEGDIVRKGDVLLTLDIVEISQNLQSFEEEKLRLEEENLNLEKLKKSVTDGENYFNYDETSEKNYYLKYEKYISDLNNISENSAKNTDINSDLQALQTLRKSVQNNYNYFLNNTSVYSLQFETYVKKISEYDTQIKKLYKEYENALALYEIGGISKSDYEQTTQNYKLEVNNKESYILDFMLDLEQKIDSFSDVNFDENLSAENLKINTLSSAEEQIKANEKNITSVEKQIADLMLGLDNSKITAPIDGTINMYSNLGNSDIIASGQVIATIIPSSDENYKLTTYIPSADIAESKVGQNVRLRFAAYPYKEYGEFSGKIESISTDVRTDENIGSYYVADVSIDDMANLELVSGMECEVLVVTKQRKIIFWLLEKLDFLEV